MDLDYRTNRHFPLGEETWVRRGFLNRGTHCFIRDTAITLILVIGTCSLSISLLIIYLMLLETNASPWISFVVGLFLLFLYIPSILRMCFALRPTSICPTWFHGELINPNQLTVYSICKPPIVIPLARSILSSNRRLKYYTTITITNMDTDESASLNMLTPEEYDRFMQYWNAAQEKPSA